MFEKMINYLIVQFSARMRLSIYQYFERKEYSIKENVIILLGAINILIDYIYLI